MPTDPHNNPTLERHLLSCLLHGPDEVFGAIKDGLVSEAFHDGRNRAIWVAMTACAAEDRNVDAVSVWRRLSGITGDASISLADFMEFDGLEPTTLRRSSLVADVLGLWKQRRMISALQSALEAAEQNRASWSDIWESTEPFLQSAQDVSKDGKGRSLADMASVAADRILNGDKRRLIPSGIEHWDRVAGSMRAGELVVIAGRPGMGKTALALQVARANVYGTKAVTAFFSLEMTGEELVTRLATAVTGRPGMFDEKLRAPAALEVGKLKTLQVFEGRDASGVSQIEARARLIAASPAGIRCIVIDYLQLVSPPTETRKENRERQVAEMSRRFKLLAVELDCPVILLAQLNRESEKDQRRPRMSDLRESGAIEQDADRIWFLYAETPTNGVPPPEDAAEIPVNLYQAKCRNGQPGIISTMKFTRPIFTFSKL